MSAFVPPVISYQSSVTCFTWRGLVPCTTGALGTFVWIALQEVAASSFKGGVFFDDMMTNEMEVRASLSCGVRFGYGLCRSVLGIFLSSRMHYLWLLSVRWLVPVFLFISVVLKLRS